MKKALAVLSMLLCLVGGFSDVSVAAQGPAPNAGDGVSDGSGLVAGGTRDTKGAPNSGDGISDGSGFDKTVVPPTRVTYPKGVLTPDAELDEDGWY